MTAAFCARAPSNIALIKYWGKRDGAAQWPANDSLSMTLSHCQTTTVATLASTDRLTVNGTTYTRESGFGRKSFAHLDWLRSELGFAAPLQLLSANSFPAGCGIASSASGLAALTLASIAAWTGATSLADLDLAGFGRERLAALARHGSGSACRSLWGGFVVWRAGQSPTTQRTYRLHEPGHWPLSDLILVLSATEKPTSSSQAHGAAWTSPLFAPRLAGLPERLGRVEAALLARDLPALGGLLEAEALEMHGVIMSATPPTHYLNHHCGEVLAWIRRRRAAGGFEAYFTMDAGPNIHLLCAKADAEAIATELAQNFADLHIIRDEIGGDPELMAYRDLAQAMSGLG